MLFRSFLSDLDQSSNFNISKTLRLLDLGTLDKYFDCSLESINDIKLAVEKLDKVEESSDSRESLDYNFLKEIIQKYVDMFFKLKCNYLEDNESFMKFCELYDGYDKYSLDYLLELVKEALLMSDFQLGDIRFDHSSLLQLTQCIQGYIVEIRKNKAPRVIMRLSDFDKNLDLNERLGKDLWFAPEQRSNNMRRLGSANTSKGEGNFDEVGIACFHEFILRPFGLYNGVAGKVTVEFPQGRLLILFEGFKENSETIEPGVKLADFLRFVIVRKTSIFEHEESFVVFDGFRNIQIQFDKKTYTVLSSVVLDEECF